MASGGDPGGIVEKMSTLLKEIKDFVQAEDPEMGGKSSQKATQHVLLFLMISVAQYHWI
jgi:hypothetical protein